MSVVGLGAVANCQARAESGSLLCSAPFLSQSSTSRRIPSAKTSSLQSTILLLRNVLRWLARSTPSAGRSRRAAQGCPSAHESREHLIAPEAVHFPPRISTVASTGQPHSAHTHQFAHGSSWLPHSIMRDTTAQQC